MAEKRRWASESRPGDRVKALSLWEPWATLMALGEQTIETRQWSTRYRGPLLICGAKRFVKRELLDLLEDPDYRRALSGVWKGRGGDGLSLGKAVALVDLYDCVATSALKRIGAVGQDRPFGNYTDGRFGWVTTGLRRLKPFPVTGRQGLFDVLLPDFEDWGAGRR